MKRGTLVIVCLATMMLLLDIAVVNAALPSISRDLHASLGGVQWVVDAYTLALAAVVPSRRCTCERGTYATTEPGPRDLRTSTAVGTACLAQDGAQRSPRQRPEAAFGQRHPDRIPSIHRRRSRT